VQQPHWPSSLPMAFVRGNHVLKKLLCESFVFSKDPRIVLFRTVLYQVCFGSPNLPGNVGQVEMSDAPEKILGR